MNIEERGSRRPKDWLIWKHRNGTGYHFGFIARNTLFSLGILKSVEEAKSVILRTYRSSVRKIVEIVPDENVRVVAINRSIGRELGVHRIDPKDVNLNHHDN